jgi:glutamine amidotransferase
MIAIIDYGVGNIGSIANMIAKIGGQVKIVSNYQELRNVSRIILPGVGSFDDGMRRLNQSGILPELEYKIIGQKIPVLGICLGAQMMTKSSEEGVMSGLGWLNADTLKFSSKLINLPLPNIGWRHVNSYNQTALLNNFDRPPKFYFVHSYYMKPALNSEQIVAISAEYGIEYACGLSFENIHCVQFHPEKSHKYGMQFFRNFLELN